MVATPRRVAYSGTDEQIRAAINLLQTWAAGTGTPHLFPDGTLALPGAAWALDPNTGFYRVGADTIGVSAGGVLVAQFWTTGGNPQVLLPNGTLAVPILAFASDPDTGIYRVGTADLGVSADGVLVAEFKTAGGNPQLLLPDGILSAPVLSFGSDGNTGVRWISADYAVLVAGGVDVAGWKTTGGIPQLLLPDGVLATPILSFASDTDTGFYLQSGGRICVAVNGVKAAEFANMSGALFGLGIGVQPSFPLHVSTAFGGDWLASLLQTSAAGASKGLRVSVAGTATADAALQVDVNTSTTALAVYSDGAVKVNGFTVGKAPVRNAAVGNLTLTNAYQAFGTAVSVSLSVGRWAVQGAFSFTNTGDTGQAGQGQLSFLTAVGTIHNAAAIVQIPFNSAGDTFFGARTWLVDVTTAGTIEIQAKKTGGAGTSTANVTQCTIEAWNA